MSGDDRTRQAVARWRAALEAAAAAGGAHITLPVVHLGLILTEVDRLTATATRLHRLLEDHRPLVEAVADRQGLRPMRDALDQAAIPHALTPHDAGAAIDVDLYGKARLTVTRLPPATGGWSITHADNGGATCVRADAHLDQAVEITAGAYALAGLAQTLTGQAIPSLVQFVDGYAQVTIPLPQAHSLTVTPSDRIPRHGPAARWEVHLHQGPAGPRHDGPLREAATTWEIMDIVHQVRNGLPVGGDPRIVIYDNDPEHG